MPTDIRDHTNGGAGGGVGPISRVMAGARARAGSAANITPNSSMDQMRRNAMYEAGRFAGESQGNTRDLARESEKERQYLRRLASGQESISAEQLRQSLGSMYGQQRSMAASAAPQNAAMMARTASQNMMRAGSGMAGQQALAGIAERQAAHQSLGNMILGERSQDMQGALQSRNTQLGQTPQAPQPSFQDKLFSAGVGIGTAALASDRNLKTNIAPGNVDAEKFLTQLKPYTYEYKNPNDAARFNVVKDEGASLAIPPRPEFRLERQYGPGFRVVGGDAPGGMGPRAEGALQVDSGRAPGGVGSNSTRPVPGGGLHRVTRPSLSVANASSHFEPVDDNGRRMGIMAQDLEKTGSKAVIDTPRGKMVDGARLASETASVLPVLNDKIKELEKKVGKAKPKKKPKKKRTAAAVESDEGDEY